MMDRLSGVRTQPSTTYDGSRPGGREYQANEDPRPELASSGPVEAEIHSLPSPDREGGDSGHQANEASRSESPTFSALGRQFTDIMERAHAAGYNSSSELVDLGSESPTFSALERQFTDIMERAHAAGYNSSSELVDLGSESERYNGPPDKPVPPQRPTRTEQGSITGQNRPQGSATTSIDKKYEPFRRAAVLKKKNRPVPTQEDKTKNRQYEEALKDGRTGFVVPSRNAPDRLSQPRETNTHRAQPMKNQLFRAPLRQIERVGDSALLTGGTSGTNPIDTHLQEAGFGLLGAQRLGAALASAFNFVVADSKQTRYTEQLKLMLKEDIQKFQRALPPPPEAVILSKAQDGRYQYDMEKVAKLAESDKPELAEAAKHAKNILLMDGNNSDLKYLLEDDIKKFVQSRHQDTLILGRARDGRYQYDMEKVASLAESDKPELAEAAMHARNILLMDHIANDVSRKNKDRAVYEFVRNSLGAVGGITALAATHGAAASAAIAKTTGYGLAAGSSINPARDLRFFKQQMRIDKASLIRTRETQKRSDFAEENKDGFKDGNKTIPVDDMPKEAIRGVHGAFRDQATREVNKHNVFGRILPGEWINEKKTYALKKDRRDFVGEHATKIILESVGVDDPDNIPRFKKTLQDFNSAKDRQQYGVIEDAMNMDAGLKMAYQLIRDMGGGKKESLEIIRNTMELAIRKKLSEDPTMALLSGSGDENLGKEIGKRMGADFSRRR